MDKQAIQDYIQKETGISVTQQLLAFIMNPQKLNNLNNKALKEIVVEYAPIFKRFRWTIDGPAEQEQLAHFEILLSCRLTNKPELEAILKP